LVETTHVTQAEYYISLADVYCTFSETLDLVQSDYIWMIWLLNFSRNF